MLPTHAPITTILSMHARNASPTTSCRMELATKMQIVALVITSIMQAAYQHQPIAKIINPSEDSAPYAQ